MFRSIQSFIIAIFVTLGLIFGMYALIKQDEPELGERNSTKLPDFVHVPKNEEVQTIAPKPDKPKDAVSYTHLTLPTNREV